MRILLFPALLGLTLPLAACLDSRDSNGNGYPDTYPRSGTWIFQKRPGLVIEVWNWSGTAPLRTVIPAPAQIFHPLTGTPLITAGEDSPAEFITEGTFVDDETAGIEGGYYTGGLLTFNPPVEGELASIRAHGRRTREENMHVGARNEDFSSWEAWGAELLTGELNAILPYTTPALGGGGIFGCYGQETMGWWAKWSREEPWVFRRELYVGFVLAPGETPPGSCSIGIEQLQADLRADTLPELDLWRQLNALGALGPEFSAVSDLAGVSIAIEYDVISPP